MAKKTTPAERRAFIEQERARQGSSTGSRRVLPLDMSFIDRKGQIIRPDKGDTYRALGRKYEEQGKYMDASRAYRQAGDDVNATRVMQEHMGQRGYSRERYKGTTALTIISLLASIFFLSPNLTGNAISNMTNSTTNFLGAGLLIVGLVAGFFSLKR